MDILTKGTSTATEGGAGVVEAPYPRAAAAWGAVLIFFLATVIANVDRGLLALVIEPVRADLGISDVQIALLQGLAFAVFYVSVGVAFGVLADHVSRRRLLLAGVVLWSLATIGCGLASNFGEMFAARLFVGFGEAALAPSVVTMLGDLFPPQRRGRPMAVYVFGSMISPGLGSVVSGTILAAAPRGAFGGVPLLATLAPWRIAFVILGAAGFAVAGLLGILEEPRRRGALLGGRAGGGLRPARAWFAGHWRVLLPFYGVLTSYSLGISVAAAWGAALLTRTYGFVPADAGRTLGSAQVVAALVGAGIASLAVDGVVRRARTRGKIRFAALLALCSLPSALAGLVTIPAVTVPLLAAVVGVNAIFGTTMLSTTTEMMPVGIKGLSISLYAFTMSMMGATLGPLAVATLTEHVFGDPQRLGTSMAIVASTALLVSACLALVSARQFEGERRRSPEFADVVRSNLA